MATIPRPDDSAARRSSEPHVKGEETHTGRSATLAPMAMILLTALALCSPQDSDMAAPLGLERWPESQRAARLEHDKKLVQAIDRESLSTWHDVVASVPHPAGSPGDAQVIASLLSAFQVMGLETERHEFTAYLSSPVSASLAVVAPVTLKLSLIEDPLPGSPFSESRELDPYRLGWNAYSGSGDITAGVVYANYGRLEDFARLAELGVDCAGKIVITRYGGNFRGFKAKYAEEAGAAGLIIYTDPRDSGYGKGLESPEGGWANCDQIQRGSLKTLPWSGDPLTPGTEATKDAKRLDPQDIALPTIPVQPVGWLAATQIMRRMRGTSVPGDWQGGMPFRYRLTGGDELRIRLSVRQERKLVDTANVLGTLRGTESGESDPGIIIGCHHDAWIYGADDPTSGLIALLETARVLTQAAKEHGPPRRTITFAAWGAEEHGIIGSTEWVEGNLERLQTGGVMYINLDAAASGLRLGVSASPSLQTLFHGAASVVPQPEPNPSGVGAQKRRSTQTALEAWTGESRARPNVGFLGGGSDHVSFLALAAIPSASISARGASGTAYHSLYDDLDWYRRVVGPDYESAALVASIVAVASDRTARARLLPFDLSEPARATLRVLDSMKPRLAAVTDSPLGLDRLIETLEEEVAIGAELEARAQAMTENQSWTKDGTGRFNSFARLLEQCWLDPKGLLGREWYKNLYTAPDETSGYASWPLPSMQKALALGTEDPLKRAIEQLAKVASDRRLLLGSISSLVR